MALADIYPAKTAVIAAGAATQTAVVAAVAGARIYVLGYVLNCSTAAGTFKFESASTALTGEMSLAVGGSIAAGFNPYGWLKTAVGEALNITAAGSNALGKGHVCYCVVPNCA